MGIGVVSFPAQSLEAANGHVWYQALSVAEVHFWSKWYRKGNKKQKWSSLLDLQSLRETIHAGVYT